MRHLLAVALACAIATASYGTDAPGEEPQPEEGPATGAVSLTQTMQADSGVAIQALCTNCNNADLSVAGLGNEHVAVLCDGMSVPAGLGQIYLLSVMPSTVIDKVAVTRGAGESQLEARAVGGSIEIERRKPADFVLNASADTGQYGWAGTRVDLSGTSGRFGGSFVGSWATQDTIDNVPGDQARASQEQLALPGYVVEDTPALPSLDRYTLEGRGELKVGRSQLLRVGIMSYEESQENGPAGVGIRNEFIPRDPFFVDAFVGYDLENVELGRRQYDAQYQVEFGEGAKLDVSAAWIDRAQDIDETNLKEGPGEIGESFRRTYMIDENQKQAALALSMPLGRRSVVRGGVAGSKVEDEVEDIQYQLNFPGFVFLESVEERSLWVEGDVALGSEVELSAGLRYVDYEYDDNENREHWQTVAEGGDCEDASGTPDPTICTLPSGDRLLPRAALSWKPVDEVQLRFSAGSGYRAPAPTYEEVCCGRRYRNNRGIRIEESRSYGIEASYQPAPGFRVGGSVFVTDFDDLMFKMATRTNNFYEHTYQNVNVPEARRSSISLDFSAKATPRVTVKGSYSWLDAENRTDGDAIPVVVDLGTVGEHVTFFSDRIPYSVERRGNLGLDFVPGRGWRVGVGVQHTGSTLIQRFDPSLSSEPSFVDAESFWVTNVNFTKQFQKGVSIFAGADNITDYSQTDLGDPHYDANWGPLRGRYVYAGLGYAYRAKDH